MQNSHHVWSNKRPIYRDAIRASNVLGAMIAKLTAQTPQSPSTQSGVLELGACEKQCTTSTKPNAMQNLVMPDDTLPNQDHAYDLMDVGSLENMLDNPNMLNWVSGEEDLV